MLLQSNANVNFKDLKNETVLFHVVSSPSLYENLPADYAKGTFLLYRKALIKLLLWSGINIFATNQNGKTAMQTAREKGKVEFIELADFTQIEQRKLRPNLLRLLTHTGQKGQSPFARNPTHVITMPKKADGTNVTLPKEIVEMIVGWVYPYYKS